MTILPNSVLVSVKGATATLPTLPQFNAQDYMNDYTNAMEVYLQEQVTKYENEILNLFIPNRFRITDPLVVESYFALELSFTQEPEFSNYVSNSTHNALQLFKNLLIDQYANSTQYKNSVLVALLDIRVMKDIEISDCRINTEIPKELSLAFKRVDVYVSLSSSHRLNRRMSCGGGSLFDDSTSWNVQIKGMDVENTLLRGGIVLNNVRLSNANFEYPSYMVFLNSELNGIMVENCYSLTQIIAVNSSINNMEYCAAAFIETLLVSNSSIESQMLGGIVKNTWFFKSSISTYYVRIDSADVLLVYDTKITNTEEVMLRACFSKLVYIDNFIVDNRNGVNVLRIENSVDVVLKNIVISSSINENGDLFLFRGIRMLKLLKCEFTNNRAKSIIRGEFVPESTFEEFIFSNNNATSPIYFDGGDEQASVRISYGKLLRNRADVKAVLTAIKAGVSLDNSVLQGNVGQQGGAIYTDVGLISEYSLFSSNEATDIGGAIFVRDKMHLYITEFVKNSVLDKNEPISVCNNGRCKGSGGAIFFESEQPFVDTDEIVLSDCYFGDNEAVRGGAIFINANTTSDLHLYDNFFTGNYVSFSGGAIYNFIPMTSNLNLMNMPGNNQAGKFGKDFATSISQVEWSIKNEVKNLTVEAIRLYPGEVFSLIPHMLDAFGNNVSDVKEKYEFRVSDSRFAIDQTYSESATNDIGSFSNLFITSTRQLSAEMLNTSIEINFLHVSSKIKLIIEQCPKGYMMKEERYGKSQSFICLEEQSNEYIIGIAVSVTVVVFSMVLFLLSMLGFICYKISGRLKYWMRRDRAEKDMEKRLLENELVPIEEDILSSKKSLKSNNFVISIDQIVLEKKIGEGGSGVVYMGRWHHHPVAVKCLKIQEGYVDSDEIEQEASLLCKLRHPNIVLFFGVSLTPQKQYLIVEYLERGSLEKTISSMRRKENPVHYSLIDKLKILIDITCGMIYLHSLKVIHRDLKPGNILLDANGVAKVCDFGISKMIGNTLNSTTMCAGTLFYLAPELLQSDSERSRITTSVDVFSFSIIMYELFFEEFPYTKYSTKLNMFKLMDKFKKSEMLTPFSVISKVLQGERPEIPFDTTLEAREWLGEYMQEFNLFKNESFQTKAIFIVNDYIQLMKACWHSDFEQRPNFETIFNCLTLLKQQFSDIVGTPSTNGNECEHIIL